MGHSRGTCRLHLQGQRIRTVRNWHDGTEQAELFLGLFFDPQMEATSSSETSVDFHGTTWLKISEDKTLHNTAMRTSHPIRIADILKH